MTSLSVPSTLSRAVEFPIQCGLTNRGTVPAVSSRLRIYLSTDNRLSSADVLLRDWSIPALAAGASQSQTVTEIVPAAVQPGSCYLLLIANANGVVTESNQRQQHDGGTGHSLTAGSGEPEKPIS